MNNSQFRNLLQAEKSTSNHGSKDEAATASRPSLGSRSRASIPMTPRSVMGRSGSGSNSFARQMLEHTKQSDGEPPVKRFKSVAAPRGTKLAQGYSDRTTSRQDEEHEQDGKIKKLKELEQMVKEEKIDQATFERLREQMGIGGDLSTTHLVKGLDFKLLERARHGEDLDHPLKDEAESAEDTGDVDDVLDHVLQQEVVPRARDQSSEEGSEQPSEPQLSLTRDEVLRRLKESRKGAQPSAPDPALGARFKKLASAPKPGKKKFVETVDGRRREVLVLTKPDGSTKRKTRWLDPEPVVQKASKPLGMEVPADLLAKQRAREAQEAEEEDDDIFQGVGAAYDPLAGIDSDAEDEAAQPSKEDPDQASKLSGARNYFANGNDNETHEQHNNKSIKQDATLMAAFKRAAALRQDEHGEVKQGTGSHQSDRSKQFLEKLKESERQDARDMDLGFGDTRYGDDDDEDGPIYEEGDDAGKPKRKRGGKKRKGDKDNVADVLGVLERRKK